MKRALTELGSGLLLGMRGLLQKELQTRSRGRRPMWLLTAYLGALAVAVAGLLAAIERTSVTTSPTIGTLLFTSLAVAATFMLAFITPALTVGAISGERERRTLDLLLVTRASALGLASGKLVASLISILYLLAASLPAFALVYLFGGVPLPYLIMVLAIAAVTALTHASIGLLLSALLKRTVVASVASYLVVLLMMLGLPALWLISGQVMQLVPWAAAPDSPTPVAFPPAVWLYVSPLLSLISLLLGLPLASGSVGIGLIPASSAPITQQVYIVTQDAFRGQGEAVISWAPWVFQFAFGALVTLLSLVVAALAFAPIKPWRRRRSR